MRRSMFIFLLIFLPLITIAQLTEIDEIAPFSEELAAVRKGNQWGFMNKEGTLVIGFRDDLVWNATADTLAYGIKGIRQPSFHNGRCIVKKIIEEVPVYGFIDTTGKIVIEHKFLNVSPFKNGYTTGIIYEKVFVGKNEIKLDVYKHKFHEVVMNASGDVKEYLLQPENIQMRKSRYKLPWLRSKLIAKNLITIRGNDNRLEIRKLE